MISNQRNKQNFKRCFYMVYQKDRCYLKKSQVEEGYLDCMGKRRFCFFQVTSYIPLLVFLNFMKKEKIGILYLVLV